MAKKRLIRWSNRRNLPVQAVCRNCGTTLDGPYCSQCGQHLMSGARRSVTDLTANMAENILVLDNKLLVSLFYLLFVPGKLTVEYMRGRIVSYVHPSKLFWFISFVFFALLTIWAEQEQEADVETEVKKEMADSIRVAVIDEVKSEIAKGGATSATSAERVLARIDTANMKKAVTKEAVKPKTSTAYEKGKKAGRLIGDKEDNDKLVNELKTYGPYVAFFLIPLFAVLVQLHFRRKDTLYVDHMAFSMHFHAFVFILGIIALVTDYYFPNWNPPGWVIWIPALYFMVAVWRVYRPKIWPLIWRTLNIMILYAIIITTVVTLYAINIAMKLEASGN